MSATFSSFKSLSIISKVKLDVYGNRQQLDFLPFERENEWMYSKQ